MSVHTAILEVFMDNYRECISYQFNRKHCQCCEHYHYIENSIIFYCDRNNWIYLIDDYYDFLENLS